METLCFLILGTVSALFGWVFLVDHSWSVTAADQEGVARFYNGFGSLLDWQRFYEGPAIDIMIGHCDIEQDSTIFEFGFGTGYLANELLSNYTELKYIGVDISKTMHSLASEKLQKYNQDRIELHLSQDSLSVLKALPNESIDRFISSYVFDLLPKSSMSQVIYIQNVDKIYTKMFIQHIQNTDYSDVEIEIEKERKNMSEFIDKQSR